MYKKRILRDIKKYCVANYTLINPDNMILGDIPYNYKCHLNSIQKVKEGKANKVFLCIAIWKDTVIVHFINQLSDGKYQDNTWGWIYTDYDYYIVKEVMPQEYDSIGTILDSIRDSLITINSNSILRKLFFIKNDII